MERICPVIVSPTQISIPWDDLAGAAADSNFANDFTHPLYRYRASISPQLTRSLILKLTFPGQTVLDPFSGGGTTAIEALAHGRRAICSDINSLACFVTRAKAWPLDTYSLKIFQEWSLVAQQSLRAPSQNVAIPLITRGGSSYAPRTHSLLLRLKASARRINDHSARRLALLSVLRVGQLCFDCRNNPPSPQILMDTFQDITDLTVTKMELYSKICREHPKVSRNTLRIFHSDAAMLPNRLSKGNERVALVLTSPPYPGVHILYHRWQVFGRRETDLPYNLIGMKDGNSESFYTLGPRAEKENSTYFRNLKNIYSRLKRIIDCDTIVAQVIAFSKPEQQIESFRLVMDEAGYEEVVNPDTPNSTITRNVPHRRWYSQLSATQNSATEYLFIHKVRASKTN